MSAPSNRGATEPQPILVYTRADFDYEATERGYLSFKHGDLIRVLSQTESGWWDGVLNGVRGWFPSTYCTLVPDDDDHGNRASQQSTSRADLRPGNSVGQSQLTSTPASAPRTNGVQVNGIQVNGVQVNGVNGDVSE